MAVAINELMRQASEEAKKAIRDGDPYIKGTQMAAKEPMVKVVSIQTHLDERSIMRPATAEYETTTDLAFERVKRGLVELASEKAETKMAEPEEAETSAPVEGKKKGKK